jgi:murein DD-endopeptidase MepM/ murein hydrolase activator NlpD
MSLTLLYRGEKVRFSIKLNQFHWLSALLAFALVSGVVIHLFFSTDAIPDKSQYGLITAEFIEPIIKPEYDANVVALTIKVAELQSHLLRLNALGNRLADEANIPAQEYDFNRIPPSGGPVLPANDNAEIISNKSLAAMLVELGEQIAKEEKQLKLLESITLGHHIENMLYLSGRPINKGWLSSYFGIRKDPFNGQPSIHKGVDFAGKEDSDIIATASGIVSWSDKKYGYGNLIELDHGEGFKTRYGHNKTLLVSIGDVVTKGQVIAKMGSTGRSTGPHVHYEILRNNKQIDPIKYVYRKAK